MVDSLLVSASALYLDLELTCWNITPSTGLRPEIIEIGVVEMDLSNLTITGEAQYYVRPVGLWEISDYCTKITGITKREILGAPPLDSVLNTIANVFQPEKKWTITWGDDVTVLKRTCSIAGTKSPFRRQLDLSRLFRELHLSDDQLNLRAAVESLGMTFDGEPHGALPDARNTAHIHAAILRSMRREQEESQLSVPETVPEPHLSPFGEKLALVKEELRL